MSAISVSFINTTLLTRSRYDLHGQWDYGSSFSQPGCTSGDCLRSHVNLTETNSALSLITKAGVPSNKIVVGVSSYGRAFEMTEPDCDGPMCHFTGPDSGALVGDCTGSAGILANAEIDWILKTDETAKSYYDEGSNSDILVYSNGTQWVSYMSDNTKISRAAYYRAMHFLGTVDWAVDLAEYYDAGDPDVPVNLDPLPPCEKSAEYHTLDDVVNDASIPESCLDQYTLAVLAETLQTTLDDYTSIMKHKYNKHFKSFVDTVRTQVPKQIWKFYHDDPEVNDYLTCTFQMRDPKDLSLFNRTGSCPPHYDQEYLDRPLISDDGTAINHVPNEYMVPKDDNLFLAKLRDDYGLDPAWIDIHHWAQIWQDWCQVGCPGLYDNNRWAPDAKERKQLNKIPIPDPADNIKDALAAYTDLAEWLDDSAILAQLDMFPVIEGDAIDGSATAVFSAQAAVAAMQNVIDIGEKAEEEQQKQLMMSFIGSFLLLIPALGEAAGSILRVALVARLGAIAGEAGNTALGIYSIVEDPATAPMQIMNILLGGLGLRDNGAWAVAARVRRDMRADTVKALGTDVSNSMDKLAKVRPGACKV